MPPKKQSKEKKDAETASTKSDTPLGKTNLKNFLFHIRDLCRNKGAQMDENGNIYADLIYDDLLFLKEVWMLVENGDLDIDKHLVISGTTLTNLKLDSIASLRDTDINMVCTVFKRLWTQLQRSNLKDIFDREFALFSILKDNKLKDQYPAILHSLLDYVGKVVLQDHEDTDPYEYFSQELKKGKSKYFGQFYTPQSLTECCVNEVKPKMRELGLDPAAGTGKFMRTAAEYISRGNKIITEQPSLTIIEDAPPNPSTWDAYQHMRMVELEPRIYRQGILGTFIKYKKIPNMNYQRKGNSFDLLIKEKEQFDYILANPPYGGTVDGFDEIYYDTVTELKGKRMISKKVIKPNIIYPFDYIKKDTCVLFLQLCVNKLKTGGRAAVIFNATIMNDQHRDVLKWFLQNCNLYKMIVNPCGSFKCTGIETYSFIFTKGTPTQKIEYYEFETNKKLGELTLAQIEEREWDIRPIFQVKKTNVGNIIYKKLSEICSVEKGTIQATKAESGQYNCYSGAEDVATHNEAQFEGPAIIYVNGSSGSKGRIHYAKDNEKFAATSLVQVLKTKDISELNIQYLLYYFQLNKSSILKLFESSNMRGTIQVEDLKNLQIPFPPLPIQQEIVANLDHIFADTQEMKDCIAKAEQRAKFILNGYLTPAPQALEAEPITDPNSIAAFIEKHIVHEDGMEVPFKKVAFKYKEWANSRPEHILVTVPELKIALSLVLGDLENEKYKGIKLI
jgi:type I restriction-modification system DNA methylase subunit